MNTQKLGTSIAVMNAKGGVGKSTVTLAVAETLSYYYGKKVLVIDSDAQMSISVMMMPFDQLNQLRADWQTLVGLLHRTLITGDSPVWSDFVSRNVSDVDETDTIDLLPGDLRLTLVERAVTEADRHDQMRDLVRSVLAEARLAYDFILIDCPPGLSLLTEIWLREADYHLAPAKPDFLAIAGLEMFREFKNINPDLKMAENLGILVNMKNTYAAEDDHYHNILATDAESRCFSHAVPLMAPIQNAARFTGESRSYAAKYPGAAGEAFRKTVEEILQRTGEQEPSMVEGVPQHHSPGRSEPPAETAPVPAAVPEPEPEPAPAPAPLAAPPAPAPESPGAAAIGNASAASGIASRFAPETARDAGGAQPAPQPRAAKPAAMPALRPAPLPRTGEG